MSEDETETTEEVTSRRDIDYAAGFVRTKTNIMQTIVEETALVKSGGPVHETIYFNISDGQLQALAGSHGNVVVSFTSWNEEKLDGVGVTQQTIDNTDEDDNPTLEAIIDTQEFLNYLDIASDGGIVELTFVKEPEQRLAQAVEIDSELTSRIPLPGSEAVLDEIPLDLPTQINEDDVLTNQEGNKLPTNISTETDKLSKIIDAVDLHEGTEDDFYPVVVEDGEFVLNVGDEKSQQIFGSLKDSSEGPDLSNEYHSGFKELSGSLTGSIDLYSVDGGPLYVLQDSNGATVRHSLGNVA